MTFKLIMQAVFINACLAIWPMYARKSGMSGYTAILFFYIGSLASVTFIWLRWAPDGAHIPMKWFALIAFLGVLGGYCMGLYTSIVVDPRVQAGIFMLTSALLYAFFSLIFDWQINGSKLSGTQRFGVLLTFAALYCLAGKK